MDGTEAPAAMLFKLIADFDSKAHVLIQNGIHGITNTTHGHFYIAGKQALPRVHIPEPTHNQGTNGCTYQHPW